MAQPTPSLNKIGPWQMGESLGQGYAAQVRQATHEETGEKVAIKILTKENNCEKADLLKKMREKEIAIMKLVDHPNIVRLYDVYETPTNIYLVMELLQGSLFSYVVKSVRVPPSQALTFFQQIIEALDYMHKHLICHRDLKPENFLLGQNKILKVCDFGFASLMKADGDMLHTRCGTLHYASPDILTEGDGYDGKLHDVWSAGVNLYVMVTGELPFNDKNPKILLKKILTGSFQYPPQLQLPSDLRNLINRMLTVDAAQRITIPEIKNHPWFKSKPYTPPVDVLGHINPDDPFEDIDEEVLNGIMLMGVGWENPDTFREQLKLIGMNTEKVVYMLLLRKKLNPSMEAYSSTYHDQQRHTRPFTVQQHYVDNNNNEPSTTTSSSSTPPQQQQPPPPQQPPAQSSNQSKTRKSSSPTSPRKATSPAATSPRDPPVSPTNTTATDQPQKTKSIGQLSRHSLPTSIPPIQTPAIEAPAITTPPTNKDHDKAQIPATARPYATNNTAAAKEEKLSGRSSLRFGDKKKKKGGSNIAEIQKHFAKEQADGQQPANTTAASPTGGASDSAGNEGFSGATSSRGRKGSETVQQSHAVSSIDRILNWFHKKKEPQKRDSSDHDTDPDHKNPKSARGKAK